MGRNSGGLFSGDGGHGGGESEMRKNALMYYWDRKK